MLSNDPFVLFAWRVEPTDAGHFDSIHCLEDTADLVVQVLTKVEETISC